VRVIRSSFRLAPGIGPSLEARLWEAGIRCWADFPPPPAVAIAPPVDGRIRAAIVRAEAALAAGDAEALAAMLPRRERWRLYAAFAPDAAFLDIETCPNLARGPGETCGEDVTCIGVLDADGPRIFLRGRDLDDFPESARRWKLLVTFNGLAFDVPALRRAFPAWRPPRAHVDLRHLWARLGHAGGLKLLEREAGVGRPPHLERIAGSDAARLWRAWEDGDVAALRVLAEYNLHDAVNLRPLMDLGYNRIVERLRLPAQPVAVAERGDFRYDMTKVLLAL
jgi:uncharacterized protein YprB with RNaseH-like and TPR domain